MSLARSSYLYLQHVATQKKLNGVQSYSQLHQMHRINYMKVSYMCIVCIVQIYTSF